MRYTPKRSCEALRQSWLTVDPADARLSPKGRSLATAARDPKRFKRLVQYLVPQRETVAELIQRGIEQFGARREV